MKHSQFQLVIDQEMCEAHLVHELRRYTAQVTISPQETHHQLDLQLLQLS